MEFWTSEATRCYAWTNRSKTGIRKKGDFGRSFPILGTFIFHDYSVELSDSAVNKQDLLHIDLREDLSVSRNQEQDSIVPRVRVHSVSN